MYVYIYIYIFIYLNTHVTINYGAKKLRLILSRIKVIGKLRGYSEDQC